MPNSVDGLTKQRMLDIESSSVVSGVVNVAGHLILTTKGGAQIDAGNVIGPPAAPTPQWPIGAIYLTTTATNPGPTLGGTWSAWGSGRVPVGVDTAQPEFATVELTGGEKTHTLTVGEMPSHDHAHTHQVGGTVQAADGTARRQLTTTALGNNNVATGNNSASSTGGGSAHNNLQPYITCYMWKRTA